MLLFFHSFVYLLVIKAPALCAPAAYLLEGYSSWALHCRISLHSIFCQLINCRSTFGKTWNQISKIGANMYRNKSTFAFSRAKQKKVHDIRSSLLLPNAEIGPWQCSHGKCTQDTKWNTECETADKLEQTRWTPKWHMHKLKSNSPLSEQNTSENHSSGRACGSRAACLEWALLDLCKLEMSSGTVSAAEKWHSSEILFCSKQCNSQGKKKPNVKYDSCRRWFYWWNMLF